MLKTKLKVLVTLVIVLLAVFVFNMNTVNAETDEGISDDDLVSMLNIVDSTGKAIGYYPPMSGGNMGYLDAEATEDYYKNCSYIAYTSYNCGDTIETELGTFKFKDKEQYTNENGEVVYDYIYTCPVNPQYIISKNGKDCDVTFPVTDIETGKKSMFIGEFRFYKRQFGKNANLKIGDVDFIINGKPVKGYIDNGDTFVGFDEMTNILTVYNYTGKITYSNMGDTFKIQKDENSNIEVMCEDKKTDTSTGTNTKPNIETITTTDNTTGIKLEGTLPWHTVLEVESMTEGETYYIVKTSLQSELGTTQIYGMYDITLKSEGVTIQPNNGKVKISIPIPPEFNKSKSTNLRIYRAVMKDGERTAELVHYPVTIEGDYATFETDHFSIYVLAEKTAETTPSNTDDRKKDETPKTGTVDVLGYLSIITLISALGIVAFRRNKIA